MNEFDLADQNTCRLADMPIFKHVGRIEDVRRQLIAEERVTFRAISKLE